MTTSFLVDVEALSDESLRSRRQGWVRHRRQLYSLQVSSVDYLAVAERESSFERNATVKCKGCKPDSRRYQLDAVVIIPSAHRGRWSRMACSGDEICQQRLTPDTKVSEVRYLPSCLSRDAKKSSHTKINDFTRKHCSTATKI